MFRYRLCMFCMLFCFFSIQDFAQPVRILSTKDGLPQSFISGIVQDSTGFIWIATRNGLARYDGIQFKIFNHALKDSGTIASNVVTWVNTDHRNNLWISYETGEIDRMDPVTEQIVHFITPQLNEKYALNIVRQGWLVDSKGTLWGNKKGNGLISFDRQQARVRLYNRAGGDLPSDTIRALTEDNAGKLWVLTQEKISYRDVQSQKFVHISIPFFQDFNDEFFETIHELPDLHFRSDGVLMWSDRKRLIFFNPVTQSFKTIAFSHAPSLALRWIAQGPDKAEYFESNGDIFRYDDFNGIVKIVSSALRRADDARSFFVDRSGVLWVGTNAAGIYQFDITAPFFKSHSYERDYPDALLRQEFGVSIKTLFDWTEQDDISSAPGYHFRSFYDRNDRLWLALKATVVYKLPGRNSFIKLPVLQIPPQSSINHTIIQGLTVSPSGIPIVVGYNGSVYLYDSTGKNWKPFIEPDLLRNKFGNNLLPKDVVADNEKLWITTEKDGLIFIDLHNKEIRQLKNRNSSDSFPTNQLLGCLEDPTNNNILWIGSFQGLLSLDKKTLRCKLYNRENGLPDNTIYSIQADRSGNLWLSTNKGLCRFNPNTGNTNTYSTLYGLPGDEYNRFHHLKLPDGRLSFGGTEGWVVFNPASFGKDEFNPAVALTSLKINNINVEPGDGNAFLRSPINAVSELRLPFSENTLTAGFAGLQFNQPQEILYRYRLVGYDDHWVDAGHSPVATYTKIPPGEYTLELNASNTNGRWSSGIKSLPISILPPWWQTWWAYLCYAIAAFGVAWSIISFRINRMQIKKQMTFREMESLQMKQMDELKNRFFSNITHEFRTPLTLILGPAEQLKNRHREDGLQKKLSETIIRNSNQLLHLINQLLDLAKLESKAMKPQESAGKPSDTLQKVLESFEQEAHNKKINLVFEDQSQDNVYIFSSEVLSRILTNLISNALKFTPENGEIKVELKSPPTGIELTVTDTGVGIPADRLPKIFDRFYQAHEPKDQTDSSQTGSGIGLSLVKELVELQQGKIIVESSTRPDAVTGTGTKFRIHFPYRIAENADSTVHQSNGEEQNMLKEIAEDSHARILIVEDNKELAEFIRDCLGESYQVYFSANGSQGLNDAQEIMPDIIVSDVMMPVMDGFEFTSHLKNDIRTSHIPVILLTAKTSQESRIEGLSAGADDYLIKPFQPKELQLRVHNLLALQRRQQDYVRSQLTPRVIAETSEENIGDGTVKDLFLKKIHDLIEEHLDDPLFGVDQIIQKMDMSRASIYRKVKSVTGMSIGEILRNYRLKKSIEFLSQGNNSSETAYMSGFGSPAYFTKCFREVYGITPGEFVRRQQRK